MQMQMQSHTQTQTHTNTNANTNHYDLSPQAWHSGWLLAQSRWSWWECSAGCWSGLSWYGQSPSIIWWSDAIYYIDEYDEVMNGNGCWGDDGMLIIIWFMKLWWYDIRILITDQVRYLAGQVEDGVLVWLDGLGGVDDEDERGVEGAVAGLTQPALGGLWASLAPDKWWWSSSIS